MYSRRQLELLADLGVLPSTLGVGEVGDTSRKYMSRGTITDDTGFAGDYNSTGVEDTDEVILSRITCINSVLTGKRKHKAKSSFGNSEFLKLLRGKSWFV
jgi:hypothetical protein